MKYKRYDVHWLDLEPVRGSEMRKKRPCVIVSLDYLNLVLRTVVACPLTSQLHPDWRSRQQIKMNGSSSEIAADQIRAVAKERIGKKIYSLSTSEAAALRRMVSEMYGDA